MERILVRLGFRNCLVVDKFGKGGALALFYAEDVSLFISSYSANHVDVLVSDVQGFL